MSTGPIRPTNARPAGRPMRFDLLQAVAVVGGVYLLVVGIVAIARAGFFTEGIVEPVVEVGVVAATPVLALGFVLAGLVWLWGAGGVEIDDVSIRVVAGIVLVLGIVLVIEPGAFQSVLGTGRGDGWHHILLGGLVMGVSFLPPYEQPAEPAPPPPESEPTRRTGPPTSDDDPTQRIR